jgi:hypothetical protein
MYKLIPNQMGETVQCIKRLLDGASIPFDNQNTDYVAYLAWLAEGNVPTPADQPTE